MLAGLKLNLEWIFSGADLTHFSVLFFRSILVNSVDFLGEFRRYPTSCRRFFGWICFISVTR
jgi:hypothetical protein